VDDRDELGPAGEEFGPDAMLYVRGVSYVAGWRDATNAGDELLNALSSAGIAEVRFQADAASDGSGLVRLTCSADAAREVAMLARVTAARLRRAS
jgi:hypothetical protein